MTFKEFIQPCDPHIRLYVLKYESGAAYVIFDGYLDLLEEKENIFYQSLMKKKVRHFFIDEKESALSVMLED